MTDAQRLTRQVVIAAVFLLVVGGLGYGGYRAIVPATPSPAPNPLAHLAPISVLATKLLNVRDNDYDFVAKVSNPNSDYGSAAAEYALKFYNAAGALVAQTGGSFYILPGQTKYIVATPLRLEAPASRAELTITSIDWQKLDPLAAGGVALVAKDYSYMPVNQGGIFSKIGGAVLNNSNYDLSQVDVIVLALDASGDVLAVNRTQINTFLAKTTRGFAVSWFTSFPGSVASVAIEANTNLFLNSTFLRQAQPQPERFQEFY